MTTITFYSYKGGVGRTLLLANMARLLSRLGQRVFAVDLDLEAPGLHYKFSLARDGEETPTPPGVVECIHGFLSATAFPESLSACKVDVPGGKDDGPIWLMPAGNVQSADYWRQLARINWHDFFYSDAAPGIPFFLELKQRIESEFQPDLLLIDSRTGVTETGSAATAVLADKVVCFFLSNRESLEGARRVLRAIQASHRPPGAAPVEIFPVLARFPSEASREEAEDAAAQARAFLNEEAPDLASTLHIDAVSVLLTDHQLEIAEARRIPSLPEGKESFLAEDAWLLFSKLIPQEKVERFVGRLDLKSGIKIAPEGD